MWTGRRPEAFTTPPPPTLAQPPATVTADYAGEVTKTTSGIVRYTAVFGLTEDQETVTAIPQPDTEGGGFDWRWLLILPAGAGAVGLVFLGRSLLQKYKTKKEWKEFTK